MLALFGIALGIAVLVGGGAMLVHGASELATRFGVSPLIVGLTIVAFGTSAPELVVNVLGAMRGETELAFGNIVGSNITNLSLVLGVSALFAPLAIQGGLVRRELPLLLMATTMMTVMALDGLLEGDAPSIGVSDSIVLMLLFGMFIYITILDVVRTAPSDQLLLNIAGTPRVNVEHQTTTSWLLLVGGATLLFLGGEITVRSATSMAMDFNVSPTIIGLFVVAIGTSMPELVTSAVAAYKNESDLAVGNVIGSCIFNSLLVLPLTGLIRPIAVPNGGVGDLVVSWGFAAILVPIFFIGNARLGRVVGAMLLVAYAVYAAFRIINI